MAPTQPSSKTTPAGTATKARKASGVWENVRTIVYAGLIAVGVRTVLYEPFNIPSGSMIPTLQVGDYLFVSKYAYGYSRFSLPFSPDLFSGRILFHMPHRGDVAVFRFTQDTSIDYIKRIVGLPGDRIQVRDGQLYLNGALVPRRALGDYVATDEHHTMLQGRLYDEALPSTYQGGPSGTVQHKVLKLTSEGMQNNTPEYTVPQGYFFAMGDNRDDSADSRFMGTDPEDLGYVPIENLVGRANLIFFSVDAAHPLWQVWEWPSEIRWGRLFRFVH